MTSINLSLWYAFHTRICAKCRWKGVSVNILLCKFVSVKNLMTNEKSAASYGETILAGACTVQYDSEKVRGKERESM